jgi:hypothetical protein
LAASVINAWQGRVLQSLDRDECYSRLPIGCDRESWPVAPPWQIALSPRFDAQVERGLAARKWNALL